ncbi:hypothetical protein B0H13DRAFT_2318180 [Mycena leptocephala]|nr:hypothetical protein B0H13DRAFT_2318180 [Mycena leptocephala]
MPNECQPQAKLVVTYVTAHVIVTDWCRPRTTISLPGTVPSLSPHSHLGGVSGWPCRWHAGHVLCATPPSGAPFVPARAMHAHMQARHIYVEVLAVIPPAMLRLTPSSRPRACRSALSSSPRTVRSVCLRNLGPLLHSENSDPAVLTLAPYPPHHVIPASTPHTQVSLCESQIGPLLFMRRGLSAPVVGVRGPRRCAQGNTPKHISPASFTFVQQPSLMHSTFASMSWIRLVAPWWQT